MTGSGRNEIVLLALVVSAIVHTGVMFYVRPRVMTEIVPSTVKSIRREPMRVTRDAERPAPVRIDAVRDVDALKDAPAAVQVAESPSAAAPVAESPVQVLPPPATAKDLPSPEPERTRLDVSPLTADLSSMRIELPDPLAEAPKPVSLPAAPDPFPAMPVSGAALPVPASPKAPGSGFALPTPELGAKRAAETFVPEQEVRDRVDEKLVEREKAAVRELLDVTNASELGKFVNVALASSAKDGWRYFKVMLSPRHELQVVPKDVVLLIDASGSIGRDRIRSIREAAKGLLRTGTNSGDRFNLVAFRDRYEYAFRSWQSCTRSAFEQADGWLDEVTAHGRTDVFATISSVLTLPRDPQRPLIALVVTDGDANSGVSGTAEILSKFTALNDGLVSVYMYGVRVSANRELIDILTRGNRGESLIYDGWFKSKVGAEIGRFAERFRDPVLSDIRVVFSAGTKAEAYPRRLRNLYRGGTLEIVGRVPMSVSTLSFSVVGLNGRDYNEGLFDQPFDTAAADVGAPALWQAERKIDLKLK